MILAIIIGLLLVVALIFLLVRFARFTYSQGHVIAWPFWTAIIGHFIALPFLALAYGTANWAERSKSDLGVSLLESISIVTAIPAAFHFIILSSCLVFLWIVFLVRHILYKFRGIETS